MYLSRLPGDVRSREFRRDSGNLHEMHRTLLRAFPETSEGSPRQHYNVLWRLEESVAGPVVLVQSSVHPDWSMLPSGYLAGRGQVKSLRPVLGVLTAGRSLRFRLVANPTNATPAEPDSAGRRPRGIRRALRRTEDQIDWLVRQGERHGFVMPAGGQGPDVAVTSDRLDVGWKHHDQSDELRKITTLRVQFDGRLIVTDDRALENALRHGVGRAKAYGCGLLTLAAG